MSNKQNRLYKKTLKENLTKDRSHAEIVYNYNHTRDNSDGLYNLKSSRNRGAITFWRTAHLNGTA